MHMSLGGEIILTANNIGRRMLFWGALALIAITGYELIVRIDAMIRPLSMFFRMWIGEKVPFTRALSYIDWKTFERPAYLLFCVVSGIISLLGRNKPFILICNMVLSVALFLLSQLVETLIFPDVFKTLTNTALVLVFLGSCIRMVYYFYYKKKVIKNDRTAVYRPYDPFNIHSNNDK